MNKVAYIILAINQKYIEIAEITCKKLLEYTNHDVILYYANGSVESYCSPRLKKINLCNFYFEFDCIKFWTPLKPFIIIEALKSYDTVISLDADIQITPNINEIEKYHNHENPIFTSYCGGPIFLIWYPPNGDQICIDWVPDAVKNHIPFENKNTPVLFTGFCIINKKHELIIDEWYFNCKKILNLTDLNEFNAQSKACIHEESILNAIIRKYDIKTNLNPRFITACTIEGVYEAFDMLNKKIPWNSSDLIEGYGSIKFLYSKEPMNNNFSIVPSDPKHFWGFHTIKDKIDVIETYKIIEDFFNKI